MMNLEKELQIYYGIQVSDKYKTHKYSVERMYNC